MITIGTVKFDIHTTNEEFAYLLNNGWEKLLRTPFESVVDDTISFYDNPDEIITIDFLPVDLGIIDEEDLNRQFPLRLREALKNYFIKFTVQPALQKIKGITRKSVSAGFLDILCFFLLHGYFPADNGLKNTNNSSLLAGVLENEPDRFRNFLESYAHYSFLYWRLIYQFSDRELNKLVEKIKPSESKFINLYIHIQIHTYKEKKNNQLPIAITGILCGYWY